MTPPAGISVRNYRGLRSASWTPEGVCLLVGANGSGKSALLSAFDLMTVALARQLSDAINLTGGYRTFRHFTAAPEATSVALAVGQASWELLFPPLEEDLWEAVLPASDSSGAIAATRLRLHSPTHMMARAWHSSKDEEQAQAARDLYAAASRVAVYPPWDLRAFRSRPLSDTGLVDQRLSPDASNTFVVLQNWRNEDATEERFAWVRSWLRRIQPSVGTLELEKAPGLIGGKLTIAGLRQTLPMGAASNGIISTLLTLTAIAGTEPGGTVLLDEPDNGLHPGAIEALTEAARDRSDAIGIHVAFVTHSPTLIDCFNDEPEQIWVTGASDHDAPTRLTELRDPEWLKSFRLGPLYGEGFAPQTEERPESEPAAT